MDKIFFPCKQPRHGWFLYDLQPVSFLSYFFFYACDSKCLQRRRLHISRWSSVFLFLRLALCWPFGSVCFLFFYLEWKSCLWWSRGRLFFGPSSESSPQRGVSRHSHVHVYCLPLVQHVSALGITMSVSLHVHRVSLSWAAHSPRERLFLRKLPELLISCSLSKGEKRKNNSDTLLTREKVGFVPSASTGDNLNIVTMTTY